MSDDELDREWKPTGRPQSTMARSFSLALNDLFKIDNSVADLDAAVSEKKQKVSSQTSELEALEARLKATEERLKAAASARVSPNGKPSGRSSPRPRQPVGDAFTNPQASPTYSSPLASEFNRVPSRPSTGRSATGKSEGRPQSGWQQRGNIAEMPGALPPTPGTSEDGVDDGGMPPPPPPKNQARNLNEDSD